MGVHKELDPSDHDDPPSQRGDVHQKQAAGDHQRQEQKHDQQVAHLLDGVEFVVQRNGMGILFAQEVVKKIEKRLREEPSFDIFHVGDIELNQTSGYKKIVKYPEKKRDRNRHARDIVKFDRRFISAEDIGIFRESDLNARDAEGDDAQGV